MDNAKEGETGVGPWTVEQSEADGFYYLKNTTDDVYARGYPLRKTALKACRAANAATPGIVVGLDLSGSKEDVAERYPDLETKDKTPTPDVKVSKSNPRNPKGSKGVSKSNPPDPKPASEVPKHAPTHSTVVFSGSREEWLNAFTAAARPIFAERGHPIPDKVRVSVGFTGSRGGKKVLGACWHEEASTDGTREIFVVPTLDNSHRIAAVLTHELCHTLFGPDEKHGRNFAKAVHDLGLEGKATQAGAGHLDDVEWHAWADPILEALGAIPHAALDPSKSGIEKQKTRLLKAVCGTCGFTSRVTAKWVNAAQGSLTCMDSDCGGDVDVITEGEEG